MTVVNKIYTRSVMSDYYYRDNVTVVRESNSPQENVKVIREMSRFLVVIKVIKEV